MFAQYINCNSLILVKLSWDYCHCRDRSEVTLYLRPFIGDISRTARRVVVVVVGGDELLLDGNIYPDSNCTK